MWFRLKIKPFTNKEHSPQFFELVLWKFVELIYVFGYFQWLSNLKIRWYLLKSWFFWRHDKLWNIDTVLLPRNRKKKVATAASMKCQGFKTIIQKFASAYCSVHIRAMFKLLSPAPALSSIIEKIQRSQITLILGPWKNCVTVGPRDTRPQDVQTSTMHVFE